MGEDFAELTGPILDSCPRIIWGLCRSINTDSSECLCWLSILLQSTDMTLSSLFVLGVHASVLGDEVALGACQNYCGELMLGSEYVLVDDPDVESISNLFVEQCRLRLEQIFCRNVGRLHCGQVVKVWRCYVGVIY